MNATKHPEFQQESSRLKDTQEAVEQALGRMQGQPVRGGDAWATEHLEAMYSGRIEDLQSSLENPYFGRVDHVRINENGESIYLGHRALDLGEVEVHDWRAPVGTLFYSSAAEDQSFLSPQGLVNTRLVLKRRFEMGNRQLTDIKDEVDRRNNRQIVETAKEAEDRIKDRLQKRGDLRLQDIVETIQIQQDRIIRSSARTAMVIDGSAGSGKTTIAYHRLAYLLYPGSTPTIRPERTIIFGPNTYFLNYVQDLLPTLGVRASQLTFENWAFHRMQLDKKSERSKNPLYQIIDTPVEVFTRSGVPREERIRHWTRAKQKGKLFYRDLLDRYLAEIGETFLVGARLRDTYYRLLSDAALLRRLGKGLFSGKELDLLGSWLPSRHEVEIEDIPGLYYLFDRSAGRNVAQFDHIVVDEAQDFSPLQFAILSSHVAHGSMTITGDLAQGIHAHRGISSWDEIEPVFKDSAYRYEQIRKSYRSTRELTAFANDVLKQAQGDQAACAEPFNRPGPRPGLTFCRSVREMYAAIVQELKGLSAQYQHIGVIVKNVDQVSIAKHRLEGAGYRGAVAVTDGLSGVGSEGQVIIIPVSLAKGVEFEAVILVDANSTEYSEAVEYDGRLVYVAVTRALHQLTIYCVGPASPYFQKALHSGSLERISQGA